MSEQRKGLDKLSEAVSRIGNPRLKIVAAGNNIHHRSWPNVIEMGFKCCLYGELSKRMELG